MIQNWSLKWCAWGRVDRERLKLKGYLGGEMEAKRKNRPAGNGGEKCLQGLVKKQTWVTRPAEMEAMLSLSLPAKKGKIFSLSNRLL